MEDMLMANRKKGKVGKPKKNQQKKGGWLKRTVKFIAILTALVSLIERAIKLIKEL
jgi:hypothetical protein